MEGSGSMQNPNSTWFTSAPLSNTNGPPPPPVFSGPVRKWKKQWVTCETKETFGSEHNRCPPLVLCRWAPVRDDTDEEVPQKRRFRYMPVSPTKMSNDTGTSESDEAKESKNLQPTSDIITSGKTSFEDIAEETQELSETQHMLNLLFGDTTQDEYGEGTKMQIKRE